MVVGFKAGVHAQNPRYGLGGGGEIALLPRHDKGETVSTTALIAIICAETLFIIKAKAVFTATDGAGLVLVFQAA